MQSTSFQRARKTGILTGWVRLPRVKFFAVIVAAVVLFTGGLSGCLGPSRSLASAEMLSSATIPGGGPPTDQLARGRRLYLTSCTDCHAVYYPNDFAPAAWAEVVEDMRARSNLSVAEAHDIAVYLETAAYAGLAARRGPSTPR